MNYLHDIVAVVIASGFSKRMGCDKLLLKYRNKRIFEYTIDLIASLDFYEKIVVTNNEEISIYAQKKSISVKKNPTAHMGKSQSVIVGASCCFKKPHMFFTADTPFLTKNTVSRLIESFDNKRATIPLVREKSKNPVIFPAAFNDRLLKLKGDKGGMSVLEQNEKLFVDFGDEKEFIDIDRREDYEQYCNV